MNRDGVAPIARYGGAIFLSSALLFLIEPIAGKRLLPLLGGSAAVWTACLVFFQVALLGGYLGAHWLATRRTLREQGAVYLALLAVAAAQLALTSRMNLHADPSHPILSVLWLLTVLIAVPFVTLSTTSSLLQVWYATARGAAPYRLYAVSNVGSMVALIIYPWLIEPRLSLRTQSSGLIAGVVLLIAVCATIIVPMRRHPASTARVPVVSHGTADTGGDTTRNRVFWIALATCGSLLLSAVTIHLSQNVATIPLLWILPLIAYLLSFVVAFSSDRWRPRWVVLNLAAIGLFGAGYFVHRGDLSLAVPRAVGLYCGALFVVCLFLHSELYARRPAAGRLTVFYVCLAIGGALGAILVGIVAPTVLPGNYELAFGLVMAAVLATIATWSVSLETNAFWISASVLLAWVLVMQVKEDNSGSVMHLRNFYGTLHVREERDRTYHATVRTLMNGIIQHGQQVFREDMYDQPTTYYGHPTGVGLALDFCCEGRPRRVGAIGLGTGTLASYGRPGDVIRFYDINPAVEPVARTWFAYLRDSRAHIDVVPGDARISLENEPPQNYDVIVVDAFTGDAIPVHLITAEALALYRRHLRPGGIVAFHISNRYLSLGPVVQQLADHAGMRTAYVTTEDDDKLDLYSTDWVLVTDNREFLDNPIVKRASEPITKVAGLKLWTDDYNSLLPILHMRSSAE